MAIYVPKRAEISKAIEKLDSHRTGQLFPQPLAITWRAWSHKSKSREPNEARMTIFGDPKNEHD